MERDSGEMDLEEWVVPDVDEFLDQHGEKVLSMGMDLDSNGVVHKNYFICPSSSDHLHLKTVESSIIPNDNQLVSVPVELDLAAEKNRDHEFAKETREVLIAETGAVSPFSVEKIDADHEKISRVFKKLEENEFIDTKEDSEMSPGRELETQMVPLLVQIEEFNQEAYKDENLKHDTCNLATEHEKRKNHDVSEIKERGCSACGGLTIWKWKANGIGVLCFIGAATAAALCILIFRNHGKLERQQLKNANLQFQTCDSKRIKQVVHHTTPLSQTLCCYCKNPTNKSLHNIWRLL